VQALDHDHCYRAMLGRDSRFDGCFVVAVRTTRIYCRPSCPAITPRRENVDFFVAAATAQHRGYRACKRCRPDATPGSPEWSARADVVGRSMRLIADGVVDREGVAGLARRVGYSERQLHRLLVGEVGTGPLAIARAQRAQTARLLLETTTMPITDVAFASGFSSVRQFNDTVREVYANTPTELRVRRKPLPSGEATLTVRLAVRQPFDAHRVLDFLGSRAVAGVEHYDGEAYMRALRLGHGNAVVRLAMADDAVQCSLWLDDVADAQSAVQRCRRLLDLDADPSLIDGALLESPVLRPLVTDRPGLRSAGHPDGAELLTRAIVGQQVSVKGARTLTNRLVAQVGEGLAAPVGEVTTVFPSPEALAGLSPEGWSMPKSRMAALIGANEAVAAGRLVIDAGSDRAELHRDLCACAGIGAWTASYVCMRALNDPDVFLPTDIGVRNALTGLGVDSTPRAAADHAEAWRPWRSYALHHLWASLS
jgi:AraC family transcriptional regulator, regulatory protein of adaptative response / DNA-3-methyladenine glycosylase II